MAIPVALMETSTAAQMARLVFERYGNYVCTIHMKLPKLEKPWKL